MPIGWRVSKKGNYYTRTSIGFVHMFKGWGGWNYSIDRQAGTVTYSTVERAKLAAFDKLVEWEESDQ